MYRIQTVDGAIIADTDYFNYVKRDNITQSWIPATPATAEAISVNGELYNIAGYPVIGPYPIVQIYHRVNIDEQNRFVNQDSLPGVIVE